MNVETLQVLNLAHNKLANLDQSAFHPLVKLQMLRLDNNLLKDINGLLTSQSELRWLNISTNQLAWFDYAFIPHSLEWLDISYNDVAELGNFYHLQNFNLHTLEAGHNRITSIDDSALPAKRLQFVQLQKNSISRVETHTFAELPYLNSVDLRNNQIKGLSKESLRKAIQGKNDFF